MGNKKNSWFVWSARLLSIFLLLLVMVVGMLAFGYAQDSAKIRVSHVDDEQFQIEADSGMIMSVIDGDAEKQTKDKIAIKSGQNILSYISEVKKSETWFWMVAGKVKMTVPEGTKVEATVRTSADNQQWSDWQDLDLAVLPDDSGVYMSEAPVLLNQKALYAQYSLVLKTDNSRISPQVDEVKLTFLDPDDKLAFVKKGWKWVVGKATGRENIKVVTRAEW